MVIGILTIIKKNFLILIRSKLSASIIIFGPLFLILILSFGVGGGGLTNIQAGFYDPYQDQFTELFNSLLASESFNLQYYNSLEECKNSVKKDKNVCIQIYKSEDALPLPSDINSRKFRDFETGYGVKAYVDFSKPRIVWGIIAKIQGVIDSLTNQIREEAYIEAETSIDIVLNEFNLINEDINYISIQLSNLKYTSINARAEIQNQRVNFLNNINQLEISINNVNNYINSNGLFIPDFYNLQNNFYTLKNSITFYDLTNTEQNLLILENQISDLEVKLQEVKTKIIYSKQKFDDKSIRELNKVFNPIPLDYFSLDNEAITNDGSRSNYGLLEYIFPSFLSFFIVFVSTIFATSLIIKERTSSSHIRNTTGKFSSFTFISGNLLTVSFIVILQMILISLLAIYATKLHILKNIFVLSIPLTLSILLFSTLGIIFGYIFNSQETGIIASVSVSLFFVIFSPLINPIEVMPEFLRTFFSYTPLILTENLINKILIFESGLISGLSNLAIIFITFSLLFIISTFLHKRASRIEISN